MGPANRRISKFLIDDRRTPGGSVFMRGQAITDEKIGTEVPGPSGQLRLDLETGAIRELNDRSRRTLEGRLAVVTAGVKALGPPMVRRAFTKVRNFEKFTPENDPYGEHDFGGSTSGSRLSFGRSITTTRPYCSGRRTRPTRKSPGGS